MNKNEIEYIFNERDSIASEIFDKSKNNIDSFLMMANKGKNKKLKNQIERISSKISPL